MNIITDNFQDLIEQQLLENPTSGESVAYYDEFEEFYEPEELSSEESIVLTTEFQDKINEISAKIEHLTVEFNKEKAVTPALKMLAKEILQAKNALITSIYTTRIFYTLDMQLFDKALLFFINDENTLEINELINQDIERDDDESLLTCIESERKKRLKMKKITERQAMQDTVQSDIPDLARLNNLSQTEIACFGSDLGGYTELQHYYELYTQPRKKNISLWTGR